MGKFVMLRPAQHSKLFFGPKRWQEWEVPRQGEETLFVWGALCCLRRGDVRSLTSDYGSWCSSGDNCLLGMHRVQTFDCRLWASRGRMLWIGHKGGTQILHARPSHSLRRKVRGVCGLCVLQSLLMWLLVYRLISRRNLFFRNMSGGCTVSAATSRVGGHVETGRRDSWGRKGEGEAGARARWVAGRSG